VEPFSNIEIKCQVPRKEARERGECDREGKTILVVP
jgi:hypothetical protein